MTVATVSRTHHRRTLPIGRRILSSSHSRLLLVDRRCVIARLLASTMLVDRTLRIADLTRTQRHRLTIDGTSILVAANSCSLSVRWTPIVCAAVGWAWRTYPWGGIICESVLAHDVWRESDV